MCLEQMEMDHVQADEICSDRLHVQQKQEWALLPTMCCAVLCSMFCPMNATLYYLEANSQKALNLHFI